MPPEVTIILYLGFELFFKSVGAATCVYLGLRPLGVNLPSCEDLVMSRMPALSGVSIRGFHAN
jgi:hypothetical protein